MNIETQIMPPLEIKIALLRANVTQNEIAKKLNVSRASVSLNIKGTSRSDRVRQLIAKSIGKKTTDIWT